MRRLKNGQRRRQKSNVNIAREKEKTKVRENGRKIARTSYTKSITRRVE